MNKVQEEKRLDEIIHQDSAEVIRLKDEIANLKAWIQLHLWFPDQDPAELTPLDIHGLVGHWVERLHENIH
jgi:hypothetical protein